LRTMTGLRAEAIALDCRTSRGEAKPASIASSGYPLLARQRETPRFTHHESCETGAS
jgi:hypothetical protein